MQRLLVQAKAGEVVEIHKIKAGYKAHSFLGDLGIHEGEKVRVVKNDLGPLIIEIKKTRVALGRGLAKKIEIKSD